MNNAQPNTNYQSHHFICEIYNLFAWQTGHKKPYNGFINLININFCAYSMIVKQHGQVKELN